MVNTDNMPAVIYTHSLNEYDSKAAVKAVAAIAEKADWQRVFGGKRVLVKPNLLAAIDPLRAVTTHPVILEAIFRTLRDLQAKVWVGDSSGETMAGKNQTRLAYKVCGVRQVAKHVGADIVSFESFSPCTHILPDGRLIVLSGVLMEVDVVLSVPKFKTHTAYVLTGPVKNLFGFVPGHLKARLHAYYPDIWEFAKVLLSVYERVRPHYTLVDAVVGLEGDGPMAGTPRRIGFLLSGIKGMMVERLMADMMGVDPRIVPTLSGLREKGTVHPLDCSLPPQPIPGFVLPQTVSQSWVHKLLFTQKVQSNLRVPKIRPHICNKCGKCAIICPTKAIEGTKVIWSRCIGCLCCFEICKQLAIELCRPIQ